MNTDNLNEVNKDLVKMDIEIKSVSEVKEFVRVTNTCSGDVTVSSERYIVDGKSIMGLFALDFSKPLTVTCSTEDYELLKGSLHI